MLQLYFLINIIIKVDLSKKTVVMTIEKQYVILININ